MLILNEYFYYEKVPLPSNRKVQSEISDFSLVFQEDSLSHQQYRRALL